MMDGARQPERERASATAIYVGAMVTALFTLTPYL